MLTHLRILVALLFAISVGQAQTLVIPQIVDGGAWLTTIAVTNESSSSETVSLTFFQETGGGATSPWSLGFVEMTSAQDLVIAGGDTIFLHTPGTAANTTIGWGQLLEADGTGAVAAYAIFTQRVPGRSDQDGTAPAAPAATRILVPFDNTSGAVTSMAIANPTASSQTVNVGIRTSSTTAQPSPITLPAQGHTSFTFPTQFTATAGTSGLAEFYSPSGSFSILALKFNAGAFTTAPVYAESGPPIIAGGGSQPNFNGTYTGTYTGSMGSGGVESSINNGVVTVISPPGTGTITTNGQITFGVVTGEGATCNFSGTIVLAGTAATGTGTFSCINPTITGNWTVTRQ
jgi:hypothetical protein